MLSESVGLAELQKEICHEPCNQKKPPKLKNWVDEEFEGVDKEAYLKQRMDKLMESMKEKPGGMEL